MLAILAFSGAVFFYVNTNSGKRFVTRKVQTYIATKIKTNFTIGSVNYHLPNEFSLHKIYLASPNRDSLLYAGELNVSIALFKLLTGETEIISLELKNTSVHISRKENDSVYNFQFIIDAFAGNEKTKPAVKDSSDLKLNIRRLRLNKVSMQLTDNYAGRSIYANVQSLDIKLKTFKPDKLAFDINGLQIDGLTLNSQTTKHQKESTDAQQSKYFLALQAKNLNLNNVHVSISDQISGFNYTNEIHTLSINKATVSLANNKIDIDTILLKNSKFEMATKPVAKSTSQKSTTNNEPWFVKVAQIEMINNRLKMNNGKPAKQGFDANNIDANEPYTQGSLTQPIVPMHSYKIYM